MESAITTPAHEVSGATAEPPPSAAANSASVLGRVETLSTDFVSGWAAVQRPDRPSYVYAMIDDEVIAFGSANISRPDLDKARQEKRLDAHAFMLVFSRPIEHARVDAIKVFRVGHPAAFPRTKQLKVDRVPNLRLFLLGSPRSGTSQLGTTLTKVLGLPWLGECHGAPLFALAADALKGDRSSDNGLVRHLARENYREISIQAARRAYFFMHGSASFVDKTPGVPMITAAPFVLECFPDARFIFQRRNPVANICSRMAKFGGDFETHCRDWAAAMEEWLRIRILLPHYIEIQQEDMLAAPERVSAIIADYIGVPEAASSICRSLESDRLEQTGAGAGKADQRDVGWTAEQLTKFEKICGSAMRAYGYI